MPVACPYDVTSATATTITTHRAVLNIAAALPHPRSAAAFYQTAGIPDSEDLLSGLTGDGIFSFGISFFRHFFRHLLRHFFSSGIFPNPPLRRAGWANHVLVSDSVFESLSVDPGGVIMSDRIALIPPGFGWAPTGIAAFTQAASFVFPPAALISGIPIFSIVIR